MSRHLIVMALESSFANVDLVAYEYIGYPGTIEANPRRPGEPPLAPSEAYCYSNITAVYEFLVNVIGLSPQDIILYDSHLLVHI